MSNRWSACFSCGMLKSRNYFEQMKGRGTRTINLDDLKKVTPTARYTKDHFVIVDAIGVTKSLKTDSPPAGEKAWRAAKRFACGYYRRRKR